MVLLMSEAVAPMFGVGDRIRKARRNVGMDQKDLAAAVGVSRPLVSRWERDLAVPHLDQAVEIALVTGTTLAWIADGVDAALLLRGNRQRPDVGVTRRYPPHQVAA